MWLRGRATILRTLAEEEGLARGGGRRVLCGATQSVDDGGAALDLRRAAAGVGESASGKVCKGVRAHGRGEGYAPSLRARAV